MQQGRGRKSGKENSGSRALAQPGSVYIRAGGVKSFKREVDARLFLATGGRTVLFAFNRLRSSWHASSAGMQGVFPFLVSFPPFLDPDRQSDLRYRKLPQSRSGRVVFLIKNEILRKFANH